MISFLNSADNLQLTLICTLNNKETVGKVINLKMIFFKFLFAAINAFESFSCTPIHILLFVNVSHFKKYLQVFLMDFDQKSFTDSQKSLSEID